VTNTNNNNHNNKNNFYNCLFCAEERDGVRFEILTAVLWDVATVIVW